MPSVAQMLDNLLRREGGYTQDPDDPGHQLRRSKGHQWDSYCTNHGITQYTLSNYWNRQASVAEVKALSKAEAKEIYRYEYFKRPRIDELPTELQPMVFDMAVNHGPKRAVKILQTTCAKAGFQIAVDGRIGFRTLKACRDALSKMGAWYINAVVEERLRFYRFLVDRNPKLNKFMYGWTKRANEFLVEDESKHIAASFADRLLRWAA